MTYISAQPRLTTSWDDICFPVEPVYLSDLLPDYDIIATDRQKLVVGQPEGGRKTIFGIQSADYAIIPNSAIRDVVDGLLTDYTLQAKYTTTGEFSIGIVLPEAAQVGTEWLQRSLILTNSYNGKTPFSIQGHTLATLLDATPPLSSSLYRKLCQNGLMGWADAFADLPAYQRWLRQQSAGKEAKRVTKAKVLKHESGTAGAPIRKIHHSRLTIELFQEQLQRLLTDYLRTGSTLTTVVYDHLQQTQVSGADEGWLRTLPIPVQLAKQAQERLRLEERLLANRPSYWLLYNAVNYALFTSRSSLTLNDRYRLDERVFHQIAARLYA